MMISDTATGVRVLGVDPSLPRSGWAVVEPRAREEPGLLGTGVLACARPPRAEQLFSITKQFRAVLQRWQPAEAWLELPGRWMQRSGSSRRSVEAMAEARGAMLATCAEFGIPADEIEFHTVRQALTGRRNADAAGVLGFLSAHGFAVPTRSSGGIDLDIANALMMAIFGARAREHR